MADYEFEYLIVGAGVLGSACAYALSKKLESKGRGVSIGVVDLDLEGEFSSTLKNAGGVRATWRNRANIELCKYSIDFYETIKDEISFNQKGYYWMHGERSWEEINKNHLIYEEYGLDVSLHRTQEIPDYLPFVHNFKGIDGLSISRTAGLIDHYSLREYYRKQARSRGVEFLNRRYVKDIHLKNNRVYELEAYDMRSVRGAANIEAVLKDPGAAKQYGVNKYRCDVLINTAGAWAPYISLLYGFEDEMIKPRRRQMVVIKCPDIDLSDYGMIVDTSLVYFHKEAENILAGYSNMDEPYGYNFDFSFGGMDTNSVFVKYIWEPLYARIKDFERVKLVRGWAGVYAETPDRSGYIGRVPGFENVYECAGHTGRGLMISYGAGSAMAELIVDGELGTELSRAVDLSRERPSGNQYEGLHL